MRVLSATSRPNMIAKVMEGAYRGRRFPRCLWSGVTLRKAQLQDHDLREVAFHECDMHGVDFTGSLLRGTCIVACRMLACIFDYTDLREVEILGTDFTEALLGKAVFGSAVCDEETIWPCGMVNPPTGCALLRPKADLRGWCLRSKFLYSRDLNHANLSMADLSMCSLENANLAFAILLGASLQYAVLKGADLSGARIGHTDLRGADLRSADLSNADLSAARLKSAIFDDTTVWERATLASAIGRGAIRLGKGVDLTGQVLSGVSISDADLRDSTFDGASMVKTQLSGSNLSNTSLVNADLRGAVLDGVSLVGADLRGANLAKCDLRNANLRGADFRGACLMEVKWENSSCEGAHFDLGREPAI